MFEMDLKARASRLLDGEFHVEDLSTLYLALRQMSPARETVTEIGDFVAHRGERTKGTTTRALQDFFVVFRHAYPLLEAGTRGKYTTRDLPKTVRRFLPAAIRRMDKERLRTETEFEVPVIHKVVQEILGRIIQHADGRLQLPSPTEREFAALRFLYGHFASTPAFNGDRISAEFCDALIEANLVRYDDTRRLQQLAETVVLFAISMMHGSMIDLGDGTKAELYGTPDTGNRTIGIWAIADLDAGQTSVTSATNTGQDRVRLGGPAVETNLHPKDCCEAKLILEPLKVTQPLASQGGLAVDTDAPMWTFPIELNANRKLSKLA